MSASYFSFLEWTLVWAGSCWLQGGPEGAIFFLGPESIFSEPEGAIVILLRILVVLILFFDLDMGEVVQNSHEFKYGMIGSAKDFQHSMFIIVYLN